MFFLDPGKGLREISPGAEARGAARAPWCFRRPTRTPASPFWSRLRSSIAGLLPRDPYQPGGLLSLGKPGLIDALFKQAGFSHVATTKVSAPFRLPSVRDYLDFTRSSAGPIVQILGRLDDAKRDVAWAEIEDRLGAFNTQSGWEGPNELLLTVGRR